MHEGHWPLFEFEWNNINKRDDVQSSEIAPGSAEINVMTSATQIKLTVAFFPPKHTRAHFN